MQPNSVTAGDIVSATRRYSNKDNAERKFNISADVSIRNDVATEFKNGSITKATEATNGSANFTKGENWISFNGNNLSTEETKEAFDAAMEFIAAVEEDVATINEK